MAIEISGLAKSFARADGGLREVFRDFSLTLGGGRVAALLGPSGGGKSTLLRLIAGLEKPSAGSIALPAGRIAMAFQEPRLLPWRSVADNLRLAAPGLTEEALNASLAAFELEGRGGDYPGQLSLGLARRVALARAFAVEPDLLLLDEPFASLDLGLHRRLRALLAKRISAKRMTVLIATHDLDDALLLADEVILLGGAPAQVKRRLKLDMPREMRDENLTKLRKLAPFYPSSPEDDDGNSVSS
ncbi:NitT/TauT family transport system ATP-binding protein [Rhodoblastus acidophilus]|uniref:ABC transporter ATP-binding protein n=1 Tax=Rhodoblastus acidophilus TaxID=1074 RepID=UPI0022257CF3|nr:ATP-binding cassette domain-containing protein [Rhodoblastus acidophilus]MCW2283406.1 NitT/TauT family transport system ATP-binding protein [Rhodoblastus acidophilus]MCW2332270.1 NitT/TauT family transport system ATP-binding protein [Rhodoblastus acidophilus]